LEKRHFPSEKVDVPKEEAFGPSFQEGNNH